MKQISLDNGATYMDAAARKAAEEKYFTPLIEAAENGKRKK